MTEVDEKILQMIPEETPIILVINKVDRLKEKSKLLELIQVFKENERYKEIIPTSVKKKNNLTPRVCAIAQLCQIQGISNNIASIIFISLLIVIIFYF